MSKPSVLFINRVYPPYRGATGRVLRDLARRTGRGADQSQAAPARGRFHSRQRGGVAALRRY